MNDKIISFIRQSIPRFVIEYFYYFLYNLKHWNCFFERQVRFFKGYSIGNRSRINYGTKFFSPIEIGSNTYFNGECLSHGKGKIKVGNYCSIGYRTSIFTENHNIEQFSTSPLATKDMNNITPGDVEIENDVWIGANTIILPGVKIGNGSIIGAGSIVTKDIPPFSVAVGNPAKVIKKRFDKDTREKISKSKWWTKRIEDIPQNIRDIK